MDGSSHDAISQQSARNGDRAVSKRGKGNQMRGKKMNSSKRKNDITSSTAKNSGPEQEIKSPKSKSSQRVLAVTITGSENESEVCVICASEIIHEGLGPCNHRTCHVCSVRMRVLFKDQTCTLCRTPAAHVIITDNRTKTFEDYNDEYFKEMDFKSIEDSLGFRFDSPQIRDDVLWMLGYNCPDKECDAVCLAWPHLHDHTRRVHGKKICDLCSKHRKIFPHEHDLFTDAELSKHMKEGDYKAGATSQSGFKGHPLCGFCGNRFYGDDELFKHLREKHERCFVCDRANVNSAPSYYVNYDALRVHFVQDHFICQMKDCLDQKYIAFVSEFELKAHMLEVHGNDLSKNALRDTRNVDLSDFSYRQSYLEERRAASGRRDHRESRRNERGRDFNREPIPPSSSSSVGRDVQASQRELLVHSAQSISIRNFGSQLSAPSTTQNRTQSLAEQSSRPSASLGTVSEDLLNLNLTQPNISPHGRARALRHTAVIERASHLLQKDSSKISQFRSCISKYKNGNITARALIDSFFILFSNTSSSALGTLIREVADIYEDPQKANDLRIAWNNWRAINEDYPSLPSTANNDDSAALLNWSVKNSTASSSGSGTLPSNRIINLKKSTAQSRQSSTSNSRSWGSANSAISTTGEGSITGKSESSNAFPSLPAPPSRQIDSKSSKVIAVPWTSTSGSASASGSSPSKASSTATKNVASSMSGVRATSLGVGAELFPALPSVSKPPKKIINYRRAVGPSRENAWDGTAQPSSSGDIEPSIPDVEANSTGKKKGNKAKKQVLMGWG
ncbi:hypothetical protein K3495_g4098 [Podosphaera aphanis]|nr:hypothetical protein K3495_g4098 [Podosphaera aphanis]